MVKEITTKFEAACIFFDIAEEHKDVEFCIGNKEGEVTKIKWKDFKYLVTTVAEDLMSKDKAFENIKYMVDGLDA